MTCRFDFAKSRIFSPLLFFIHASRIFHSFGTVQSKTCVPVGTSCRVIAGQMLCKTRSVSRTPLPVILRQIGNSRSQSAYISLPILINSHTPKAVRIFINDMRIFTYCWSASANSKGNLFLYQSAQFVPRFFSNHAVRFLSPDA